jgi:hypothetical protein
MSGDPSQAVDDGSHLKPHLAALNSHPQGITSMNTHPPRDTVRVHISPDHKRQVLATAARIEALTGKKPSMPIVLRAGIAALEAHVIAASKEQARSKDGTVGTQVTRMLWWLAAAARSVGGA